MSLNSWSLTSREATTVKATRGIRGADTREEEEVTEASAGRTASLWATDPDIKQQ